MKLWHRILRRWRASVMALALLGFFAVPTQAADPSLTIGYVPVLGLTPALVASSLGIYAKEGLNVHLAAFASGPALYQAMAGGRVQMAYAGVPALLEWGSRGLQVKAVANVEDGTFDLMARRGYHGAIAGATIGDVGPGSGQDVMLRGFLLPAHHLALSKVSVRYLPLSDMLGALSSGQLDMALLGAPQSTLARLKGATVVASVPDPGFILLATQKLIQAEPQVVAKVVQAHIEAIAYVHRHPAAAAAILAKDLNIPAVVTAKGRTESPTKIVEIGLKTMHFNATFAASDFSLYQKMNQQLVKLGLTQHLVKVRSFFDLHWLH